MDRCVILMLFTSGFGFSCSSHLSLRTYHIITKGLTWEGAQQYCRENFQDLATFESMDDVNSITELYDWSWIGLHEYSKSWKTMSKDINSWRWSLTGEGSRTGYYKWMDSEPDNHMLMEHCVGMKPGGYWFDTSCQKEKRFVCYDGNTTSASR
ncbi:L-selectin-like [Takifugu rubripes]|uniref:L-selectin-like n=1 Tax=Takifugu rubripes TaxID=31033 RepID=UPI0011457394|nr:L-selectin-like [Takifugu rubripes]